MPRRFGEDFYLTLKAQWRKLVRDSGGVQHAAALTRGSEARISEYGAPHCMDRFPAIDQIADLELDCGIPVITRALADLHGMDLVLRETKGEVGIHGHFVSIIKEVAELQARMASAMADKKLTDAEKADIIKEARDLVDVLLAMIAEFSKPSIKAVK